jgi:PIN domain nuclease of toxin-antitoxin system
VLDASALMAVIRDEEGASVAIDAIADGAAISLLNWAEVLSKAADDGDDPKQVAERIQKTEFADADLRIEPITEADCIEIAKLRPKTKTQGLSLADRACLVLAARLGVPALTADSIWTQAEAPAEVKLIR